MRAIALSRGSVRSAAAVLTLLLGSACAEDGLAIQDGAAAADSVPSAEDASVGDADHAFLRVPPLSTSTPIAVPLTLSGTGESTISVQFTNGVGLASIAGREATLLAYRQWNYPTRDLIQAIGVSSDAIYLFWAECSEGQLNYLHLWGTDTPWRDFSADGTCVIEPGVLSVDVSFPALVLTDVLLDPGYIVAGTGVDIRNDGTGHLRVDGIEYEARVSKVIDCLSCGMTTGWLELHMVLRETSAKGGVAIMYLFPGSRDVEVDHGVLFPSLTRPARTFYGDAIWSRSGHDKGEDMY